MLSSEQDLDALSLATIRGLRRRGLMGMSSGLRGIARYLARERDDRSSRARRAQRLDRLAIELAHQLERSRYQRHSNEEFRDAFAAVSRLAEVVASRFPALAPSLARLEEALWRLALRSFAALRFVAVNESSDATRGLLGGREFYLLFEVSSSEQRPEALSHRSDTYHCRSTDPSRTCAEKLHEDSAYQRHSLPRQHGFFSFERHFDTLMNACSLRTVLDGLRQAITPRRPTPEQLGLDFEQLIRTLVGPALRDVLADVKNREGERCHSFPPGPRDDDDVRTILGSDVYLGSAVPPRVAPGGAYTAIFAVTIRDLLPELTRHVEDIDPESRLAPRQAETRWPSGVEVGVRLRALPKDLRIEPEDQRFVWDGRFHYAVFEFEVPETFPALSISLTFCVTVGGVPITKLHRVVRCTRTPGPVREPPPVFQFRAAPRRAYASYAWPDHAEVHRRLASIRVATGMDIFDGCAALDRPGLDRRCEIRAREGFLLFWSEHAAICANVDDEWRCALACWGSEQIQIHDLDRTPLPADLGEIRPYHRDLPRPRHRPRKIREEPTMKGNSARRDLKNLLVKCYNELELRALAGEVLDRAAVAGAPRGDASLLAVATWLTEACERRGQIDELLAEAEGDRPKFRNEVRRLRHRWRPAVSLDVDIVVSHRRPGEGAWRPWNLHDAAIPGSMVRILVCANNVPCRIAGLVVARDDRQPTDVTALELDDDALGRELTDPVWRAVPDQSLLYEAEPERIRHWQLTVLAAADARDFAALRDDLVRTARTPPEQAEQFRQWCDVHDAAVATTEIRPFQFAEGFGLPRDTPALRLTGTSPVCHTWVMEFA